MRKIDTTLIVDPNVEQPFGGPSLDFLTQNQLETLNSIMQSIIGPSYSATQVYVLWGCVVTGVTSGSGNFAMTAGAVFFGGEIYQIAAVSTTAVGLLNAVYSTVSSNPTTIDPLDNTRALDPVTFSDGSSKNVHITRTWVTNIATSGPNPVNGWIYLPATITPLAVGSSPAYGGNFVALDGLYFYKKNSGEVIIFGDASATSSITNPGTLFTLPAGYRPSGTRMIGMAYGLLGSGGTGIVGAYIQVTSAGVVSLNTFTLVATGSSPTVCNWYFALTPFVAGQ